MRCKRVHYVIMRIIVTTIPKQKGIHVAQIVERSLPRHPTGEYATKHPISDKKKTIHQRFQIYYF